MLPAVKAKQVALAQQEAEREKLIVIDGSEVGVGGLAGWFWGGRCKGHVGVSRLGKSEVIVSGALEIVTVTYHCTAFTGAVDRNSADGPKG